MTEERAVPDKESRREFKFSRTPPIPLKELASMNEKRDPTGMEEFDRVIGGGVVPGSFTLLAGPPGIGKSTFLLQLAASMAASPLPGLYISGEESAAQLKLRAERLGIRSDFLVYAQTDMEEILREVRRVNPRFLIVDSIQSVFLPSIAGPPGSVTQVRECAGELLYLAKSEKIPVFISGQVTKEGAIAGPRVLEHIVDVVLYLEGEPFSAYRLLRCVKNRFGSTNEIGVFEMKERGLIEVDNPSQVFLSQRGVETVGSVVVSTLEGSRPLLVEIQALTNPTSFGLPRRTANGVDFGRLLLVVAVLARRVGLKLMSQDIIANVTGGLRIGEPAADLGIALAIASSFRDVGVDRQLVAVGEVGLSGELRAVSQLERRVTEAARLGFKRCVVPKLGARLSPVPKGIELIPVSTLREAIGVGLVGGKAKA